MSLIIGASQSSARCGRSIATCPKTGLDQLQGPSLGRYFSKYRPLLAHAPLVGLELPAGEFVALAFYLPGPGGAADRLGAGLHRGRLCRTLEQALTLRRAIRTQLGVAGLVTHRNDHLRTAVELCGGFFLAAFETAAETEPRPGLGKLIATTAERHYRDLPE